MCFVANYFRVVSGGIFMAVHHFHAAWFSYKNRTRFFEMIFHMGNERAHALTSHFFIAGESQVNGLY